MFESTDCHTKEALPVLGQKPYPFILALLTAILTNLGLVWLYWHFGMGADFEVFWRAARNPTPYAFSPLPFGNPPTMLLLLQPLKLLPLWWGFVVWDVATLALFFHFGSRLYNRNAALLGIVSPALVTALIAGQVSLLVGALVFAAFLSGPTLCGILLGIAACTKPQMVFLGPVLFLYSREVKPLAAFCASVAILAAVVTIACGPSIWSDWIQGMRNMLFVARHRGALFLSISPMTYGTWIGIFSMPAALIGLYLSKNLQNDRRAAAVVAASLFAAPYSMMYDLAPLAIFTAAVIFRSSDWRSIGAALSYSGALGPLSIPCLWPALRHGNRIGKVGSRPCAQSRRTWMLPTR